MNIEERRRFEKLERHILSVKTSTEGQVADTKKFIYEIKGSLDDLIILLKGDNFGNSNGLIGEIKDQGRRLKKLETLKNRLVWVMTGTIIPGSYGVWEFLKKIIPLLTVLIVFSSCMTQKKREDIAHRHFRENPIELAKISSTHYPILPRRGTVVHDTLRTVVRDTIDCPDSTRIPCPPCDNLVVYSLRVDTVPDLARISVLEAKIFDLSKIEAVLESDNSRIKKQSRLRLYMVIVLGISLAFSLYLLFKP